jgi:hypothetical protein
MPNAGSIDGVISVLLDAKGVVNPGDVVETTRWDLTSIEKKSAKKKIAQTVMMKRILF